ncbi:MAG: hypothetical protein U5K55_10245 [Aliarcobacter sp.]|nr:hypothetical protein [Aliarcobacter sp.]
MGLVMQAHMILDKLKDRVNQVCNVLLQKSSEEFQATKEAVRKVI